MFRLGEWTVDPALREIDNGSQKLRLSPKAMAVLLALEEADGSVVGRGDLLERVWPGVTVGEEVLTQAIAELRRSFGDRARAPNVIETVHKSGYRLRLRSEPVPDGVEDTPGAVPETAATEPMRPVGERKRITVLAADLASAGAVLAAADPEEAEATLDRILGGIEKQADRFGGMLVNRMNDRVMFLFGAPVAQEDHTFRAARAALAIRDEICSTQPPDTAHIDGSIRIAISCGEAVLRHGAGNPLQAVGAPMTSAAQILPATPTGVIRLDAATWRRISDAFDAKPAIGGTHYDLVGLKTIATGFERRAARGLTRFVGREFEMDLLRHSAEKALEGSGQIVAVSGEAGIGKSRLVHEFLVQMPQPEDWLVIRVLPSAEEASPFRALLVALRAALRIGPADDDRTAIAKLRRAVGEREDMCAPLCSLLYLPFKDSEFDRLDPRQRLRRIEEALCELLVIKAATQPVVLVMEDLHWLDARTVEILGGLVRTAPQIRLLLVLTSRPEFRFAWHNSQGFNHRQLDPMSDALGLELLQALLGTGAVVHDIERQLIDRTRGNPLFLEESVTALAESGFLTGQRGAYARGKAEAMFGVPDSVHEILAARIDRLAAFDKEILQVCSVIGAVVPLDLLQDAVGAGQLDITEALGRLHEADFVHRSHRHATPTFAFKHAMTREVAYGVLLAKQKADLHRQVAEAMERIGMHRRPENAAAMARHWTNAGLGARAIPYWLQAGKEAVARSANRLAVDDFRAGLALISEITDQTERDRAELDLLIALGVPLGSVSGVGSPEVGEVYGRAESLWRHLGSPTDSVAAAFGYWLHHCARSDFGKAKELADDILALAERSGDIDTLVQAHHAQWGTLFDLGEFEPALAHVDALLELPRPGDARRHRRHAAGSHDPWVCGLGHGSLALWIQGHSQKAFEYNRRARAIADELEHPASSAHALLYALKLQLCRREPSPVFALADALSELAAEHGMVEYRALAESMRGWACARIGEAEGLRLLGDNLATYRSYGRVAYEAKLVAEYALLTGQAGRFDDAFDILNEAFEISESGRMTYWLADFHRMRGLLTLMKDPSDLDAAEKSLRQALEIADEQGARMLALRAATDLVQILQQSRRSAEAVKLLTARLGSIPDGSGTLETAEAEGVLEILKSA